IAGVTSLWTKLADVTEATTIRPFQVNAPEAELTKTRRPISATQRPEREMVTDTSQCLQLATMRALRRRQLKLYLLALSFLLAVDKQATGQRLETFTTIDVPGASYTDVQGINPRGDIVGQYMTGGVGHGYLLSRGEFVSIDFPGANSSFARG